MPTLQELLQLLNARDRTIRELEKRMKDSAARISELEEELSKKELELELMKRHRFGTKSEKTPKPIVDGRLPLFPDFDSGIEVVDNTSTGITPDKVVDAIEEETRERQKREKAKGKERQRGKRRTARIPSFSGLDKVVCECYPEGYDKDTMEVIGYTVTSTLEEQKHKFYIKEVKRYKCISKSEKGAARMHVLQSPLVPRICEAGYLGDSIIAGMLVDKFCYHLPEYRQAKMFKERGIDIPTSTINRVLHQAVEALYPIYYAQMKAVLKSSYVHMDESTIDVNDREGHTRKGYIWDVVDGSPSGKGLFFYYRSGSRSQDVMRLILDGYKGAVQVDGYKAYEALKNWNGITVLNCMAHARRKFEELKTKYPEDIQQILKYFAPLYLIEKNLKERQASPDEIRKAREEQSKPILDSMKQWMEQKKTEVTPKSGLGEAINYALTRWDELCAYLKDGIYNIDNNPVERSIRPLALGRKNWLFIKNDESGEDLAVIITMVNTCNMLGVNPRDWLVDVFSKIAGKRDYDPEPLLPYNYKKQ